MAGRESRDRHEQVVQRITRCGRLRLHRFVACWLGMASRLGERCSEGKCPLSPLKPARSQPPFHPRSRMIIGCEHVALAQHDRDVSPHTVTIKGFGGRSAPKRHNTPEAVDLARQAFELRHGVEDLLSLAGVLCGSSAVPSRVAGSHAPRGWRD